MTGSQTKAGYPERPRGLGTFGGEEGRFVSLCNDFRYDPPGVVIYQVGGSQVSQ